MLGWVKTEKVTTLSGQLNSASLCQDRRSAQSDRSSNTFPSHPSFWKHLCIEMTIEEHLLHKKFVFTKMDRRKSDAHGRDGNRFRAGQILRSESWTEEKFETRSSELVMCFFYRRRDSGEHAIVIHGCGQKSLRNVNTVIHGSADSQNCFSLERAQNQNELVK